MAGRKSPGGKNNKARRKQGKTALPAAARRTPDDLDWSSLTQDRLVQMRTAGERVRDCMRVLAKTQDNVVGEILKTQGAFYEWDHYPDGDVYDRETHAQYYYHAHPAELRGGEHGHFHTFIRPKGIPRDIRPAAVEDYTPPDDKDDALSHLIAVSMDRKGVPIRLFTTNRWVTGEVWYRADDVIRLLDRFDMDLAWPSWPTNIWLTNMLRLFRPQIELLLKLRDTTVANWTPAESDVTVYEDRDLEITSTMDINIDTQMARIDRALRKQAA